MGREAAGKGGRKPAERSKGQGSKVLAIGEGEGEGEDEGRGDRDHDVEGDELLQLLDQLSHGVETQVVLELSQTPAPQAMQAIEELDDADNSRDPRRYARRPPAPCEPRDVPSCLEDVDPGKDPEHLGDEGEEGDNVEDKEGGTKILELKHGAKHKVEEEEEEANDVEAVDGNVGRERRIGQDINVVPAQDPQRTDDGDIEYVAGGKQVPDPIAYRPALLSLRLVSRVFHDVVEGDF
eukprot:767393-Hanusia_phi.AAC.4